MKTPLVRKSIFGALPGVMEFVHPSGCSKYYPGFSPAFLASIISDLHKTVLSKLSFGDIHQLTFTGSIKKRERERHKKMKTVFMLELASRLPTVTPESLSEISASGGTEFLLSSSQFVYVNRTP